MGYPMAFNLLRKIAQPSTLTIFDVNAESLSRFMNESASLPNAVQVSVANTPREVAEQSVVSLFSKLIIGHNYYNASGVRTRFYSL